MRITYCWLTVLFITLGSWTSAYAADLVGTWTGTVQGYGIDMRFVFNADGSADLEGEMGRWRVQGSRLLLSEAGETVAYDYTLQGGTLTLSGADLMAPMVLRRVGAGRDEPAPRDRVGMDSPAPLSGQRSFDREQAPAMPPTGSSGYFHEKTGLGFAPPPGWRVTERSGVLLLGSDTEAGLIIIRLARGTTLQQLMQEYGEGIQEDGLNLLPTVQPGEFDVASGRAVAGELSGTAQDGARLKARSIAVQSPFGDAAVVFGITSDEKYPAMKSRVESMARGLRFSRPKSPPVVEAIAGQWFYISSSSFGSSERYLNLCSDGRFSESSNIYSSGSSGTAYGESGNTARWSAEGDANQGVVTVNYPNGNTSQFQYRTGGGGLYVGGRKYARYGDGSCTKTSVY